jgi:hypothetical protein
MLGLQFYLDKLLMDPAQHQPQEQSLPEMIMRKGKSIKAATTTVQSIRIQGQFNL